MPGIIPFPSGVAVEKFTRVSDEYEQLKAFAKLLSQYAAEQ